MKSQDLGLLEERWRLGDNWFIGTDGGLKSNVGTTGITLHNKVLDKELCYSFSAETCGLGHLHSTREEIRAVVAEEAIIKECNEHFGYSMQNIEFICDNKSALSKIKYIEGKQKTVPPLGVKAELLMELSHIRENNDNKSRTFQ